MCTWDSPQTIDKGTKIGGNRRTRGDRPNYCIIKIGRNTEKSPGYLRTLKKLKIQQEKQGHIGITIDRSAHPQRKENETKKCSYCLNRQKIAFDFVPQSEILHCLKTYNIPDQIAPFIEKAMQIWRQREKKA